MTNGAEFLVVAVLAFAGGAVSTTVVIAQALRWDRRRRAPGARHRAHLAEIIDLNGYRSEHRPVG